LEHSVGVQYGFSPTEFKSGDQWSFYDLPLVANYSAFYRLPLGNPERIGDVVSTQPGSFGFNEATRQFRLPNPTGAPELNLYASRSTIDTGITTVFSTNLYNVAGNSLDRQDFQQDLTVTSDLGTRLTLPLQSSGNYQSSLSAGPDFKTYELTSAKTNLLTLTVTQIDYTSDPSHPTTNVSVFPKASSVPTTFQSVNYFPLALRYDGTLRDRRGSTSFGLGFNANLWKSVPREEFDTVTGSPQSSGYWVTLTPSISRDLIVYPNWVLTLRADGQWASEPLMSNERFGAGGVNSVRGYREGEVFGDTGWHISLEQKTPAHVIGLAYGKTPMTIRGGVYLEYAETYLLDPNGAKSPVSLWGTGFGTVLTVGPHWEARFLFSLPLLSAGTTEAFQPRFNFSLVGQF
jgi:hemolysin activation/secretion protein